MHQWDQIGPKLILLKIDMCSDVVVRGGVEPPTFRFSGTGILVQQWHSGSFAVLNGKQ